MNRTVSHAGLLLSFVLGFAACGQTDEEAGGDDMTETDESALDVALSPSTLAQMETLTPEAAAGAMVSAPDHDGCKKRVRDAKLPNVVHVYLDNCTGRFGRHHRSGEMVITFSQNDDGSLHAEHQSVWFTVDGRDATRKASADISLDGDMRHVVWHGEKSKTNAEGVEVTRVADHVIDIDRASGCSVVNGTATVTRGDRVVHAVLNDLTSCDAPDDGRYCPTGTIEATVEGREVEITKTFDGTETAMIEVSKPRGDRTRELLLDCIPVER